MFDLERIFFLLILLLPSLAFHEAAHAYVAYYFGDPTAKYAGRLTLNPLAHLDPLGTLVILLGVPFGWAKPVPVNLNNLKSPRWHGLFVALAGPASNFLLALVLGFLWHLTSYGTMARILVDNAIILNLTLAVFNLIPIPPLDGSKILISIFPPSNYSDLNNYLRFGPIVLLILIFFFSDILDQFFSLVIFPLYNFVIYTS